MSTIVETPSLPADASAARDALQEISACRAELEAFLSGEFDQWERLADGLLAGEVARHQTLEEAQRAALEDQIERLRGVAAELTNSLAGTRQTASKRR